MMPDIFVGFIGGCIITSLAFILAEYIERGHRGR